MTNHEEKSTEGESDSVMWLQFAEELVRREEMNDKDRQEEFNHLQHLSEYERFWKICVRGAKKNREEWLVDMYDETYSEWVIYLVEHHAAEDDYLRAMALILLGVPMTEPRAISAWKKLKEAGFNGIVCELAEDVFEVRLVWMPVAEDAIRNFIPLK